MINQAHATALQLEVLGFAPLENGESIALLGPLEPGFWAAFTGAPEYIDGRVDPLDRWSKRVIGALADLWGGAAVFPSDGPPYPAFLDWAERSGRCWVSPVGLRVHDSAGLWLSFRGAIRLRHETTDAQHMHTPCTTCVHRPCVSACPVDALARAAYDVTKCHAWLDKPEGTECITRGCAVRRACPVSEKYGRVDAQSEFHMKAFHRT